MSYRQFVVFFLFVLSVKSSFSQYLKAGFEKSEFEELMCINTTYTESKKIKSLIPQPSKSKKLYESPDLGLDNKWELWMMDERIAIIGIRGSTTSAESWLSNLFAVQIPAKDTLIIAEDLHFAYKLAENPKASVHAGYVFSSAFLLRDILPKLDSLYAKGIKDIIITGHSQGGGLSYLLAANLFWRQVDGHFPKDVKIKVYTSASPKPGNLYFSYDYDRVAHEGWSYNVVSTEDWVPQSPFSVQTIDDLPAISPLSFIRESISQQSFFKRLFLNSIYRKITKPPFKTVKAYQKYLGKYVGSKIKDEYKDFEVPKFGASNEYIAAGRRIVLYPDSSYHKQFDATENPKNFMLHHSMYAYYYLLLNNQIE